MWRHYANKMKQIIFLLVLSGSSVFGFSQTGDEAAIKSVIEKETQAFSKMDAEGMISCWANTAYAMSLVYYGSGIWRQTNEKMDLPARYRTLMKMAKPDGSSFSNAGYVIHIGGNLAFVYYDQITTAVDGSKAFAHEVRNLEKIDGEWKLIYVGGVFYTP